MDNQIISEDFSLTEAIEGHIQTKFDNLKKAFPTIQGIKVFLSKEANHFYAARFQVHHRGKDFFSESRDADVYKAITDAKAKLKRQVLEFVDKRNDFSAKPL